MNRATGQERPASRAVDPCPVPHCTRRKSVDYLMCRPDWSRVPPDLRDAVYRAVAAWRRGRLPLADLRAVQAAAIDAATPVGRP